MFHDLADKVNEQFTKMQKENKTLFVVDVTRDELFDHYISLFPAGTNPVFQERTEHDCNCCKNFIRNAGNVISISGTAVASVWDTTCNDELYDTIAAAMSIFVKSKPIINIFIHNEPVIGKQLTPALLKNGSATIFQHFYGSVDKKFYNRDMQNTTHPFRTNHEMIQRAMSELTIDACESVIDLIKQGSIYRGSEHLNNVQNFLTAKRNYNATETKELFCWSMVAEHAICRFKNTVIGTLIADVSEGKDLEDAVKSFEAKVAPSNYKRPTALITPKMVELAVAKIQELDINDSLKRRYARLGDITINNVIFADKDVAKDMKDPLTALLMTQTKSSKKTFDKVEEISIDDFIKNVVPSVSSIEVMVENSHIGNFVSLIAPEISDSKNILQWDNNFSWAYNGGVTDSIKQSVKSAGGNVDGDLRISLSWINGDDLDLHCHTPRGSHIYYSNKSPSGTKGQLDIDMQSGGTPTKPSVENIYWTRESDMENGIYKIGVHQYSKNTSVNQGFIVEIEFKGQLWNFVSTINGARGNMFDICEIKYDGKNVEVKQIHTALSTSSTSKEFWSLKTNEFVPVSAMMLSPNHWDDQSIGNKHYMFMLQGCKNPDRIRGLYNEFLSPSLNEHRKVFEVLGDQMKCQYSEDQLSGLGFSSTTRNSIICKVSGNVTRMLKIIF